MKHNNCCISKIIEVLLIILSVLFFIIYSCFLMYKTGFKGQVSFFSDIIGIMLTSGVSIFITLHFTDIRLKNNRRNELMTALYLEDHKFIIKTIKRILSLTADADSINIETKKILNDLPKYKHSKGKYNNWIGNHSEKLLKKYNKLGTSKLHYLKLNHKSLIMLGNMFYNLLVSFDRYYNDDFMENPNHVTIFKLNNHIQEVNKCIRIIANKLTRLDKIKKNKIEMNR